MNQQKNMECGTEEGCTTEETDTGEIRDEEQEEEHQKARAMASLDLLSRREVEDDNLTNIPSRS